MLTAHLVLCFIALLAGAIASTGKEPPFLIGQLLALGLLVVIGLISLRHFRASTS